MLVVSDAEFLVDAQAGRVVGDGSLEIFVVEAAVEEAFAPVKNKSGAATDTAETSQALMIQRDVAMLRQAGVTVTDEVAVEINPLYALDAEELATKIEPGRRITEPTYFDKDAPCSTP